VSNPPASASPGSTFSISDTVQNASLVDTGYTTTRYYLSLDGLKSADDVLLTAVRTVLSLAPGATSSGSRTLTVPATMPPGPYTVLACADDTFKVDEVNESNNCRASAAAVVVALPDLVVTALTNPPSTVHAGGTFSITDTVQNVGPAGTDGWSTVRYFLSLDLTFDATDLQLTASRSMNSLAPGASSTGTRTLRMPASPGTYYVIACADADADIAESDEANNCRVSATPVNVQGQ
jgi:subtilase family serine protease